MGGNVSIIKNGKKYNAQKIPVKEIGLSYFKKELFKMLENLNDLFEKEYNYKIWNDFNEIKNGNLFNGSSSFMLSPEGEDLIDLKPSMGDIDLIVPKETKFDLWDLLKDLEGKEITNNIIYIGNNRNRKDGIGEEINALFELKKEKLYFQIDFEFLEFEKGVPTEWAKFSHSSTVEDLKAGMKAVLSRYLERSMTNAISLKDGIFVTATANCDNWEKKIKKKRGESLEKDNILKFSLKYGIRTAYEILDCPSTEGLNVFKEIKPKEGKYIKDLNSIFKLFFGVEGTEKEIKQFWSFVGKVELIEKYLDKYTIIRIFERFFELLFGNKNGKNSGQELERGNPELDYKIKISGVNYLFDKFYYLKDYFNEETVSDYYRNYSFGESLKEDLLKDIFEKYSIKNTNKNTNKKHK